MKRCYVFLLTVIVLALPREAVGQSPAEMVRQVVEDEVEVKVSHLTGDDSRVFEPYVAGYNLVGRVQTGTFEGAKVMESVAIPINGITSIKARRGTQWALGLGVGALGGLALAGAVHLACATGAETDCERPAIGYPAVYAISAGVGALLGVVVGALSPNWPTVYSRQTSLGYGPVLTPDGAGIGLRIGF